MTVRVYARGRFAAFKLDGLSSEGMVDAAWTAALRNYSRRSCGELFGFCARTPSSAAHATTPRVQTHMLSDDGRACAHTSHHVHLSADNNFFATSVAFWRRRDVQRFLHAIDRKSLIYAS